MSHIHSFKRLLTATAIVAVTIASAGAAFAAEMTQQQIIDGLKLKKPPVTRGLSAADRPTGQSSEDQAFIKRVTEQPRSLSPADRDQMAAMAKTRPSINLEINFEYNSDKLSRNAMPQLDNLGRALTSAEMTGTVIMLGGHTDAKGSDDYNQNLSERRAETVKRFLVETYKIPAENLVTAGYGEQKLKNPAHPNAAENRRVEIVNVAEREQASNQK